MKQLEFYDEYARINVFLSDKHKSGETFNRGEFEKTIKYK